MAKKENLTGIELIAKERKEQIEKHLITIKSDVVVNGDFQLSSVASSLAIQELKDLEGEDIDLDEFKPYNWDSETFNKMMKKPYLERLIISGALIAAEIDRLKAIEDDTNH